jgi:hypothetical protein
MRPALLLSALLLALALSGCSASNGPGGQSASGHGSLAYNGASSGSHSNSFECSGSAEVDFSANLGSGSVSVTVKDSAGKTVYSKSYGGVGESAESKSVTGASGTWQVSATRTSGFSGQYAVSVSC